MTLDVEMEEQEEQEVEADLGDVGNDQAETDTIPEESRYELYCNVYSTYVYDNIIIVWYYHFYVYVHFLGHFLSV